ncbi:hypothetical protein ZWY2020_011220 [Hordeum vulgare]|nr:hypothetical protein ZWY2020_011220 [Hordeum vulgare]
MVMMMRLQREKAKVQMELHQFRRFTDEKIALDAVEIDHLRALVAGRALPRARPLQSPCKHASASASRCPTPTTLRGRATTTTRKGARRTP